MNFAFLFILFSFLSYDHYFITMMPGHFACSIDRDSFDNYDPIVAYRITENVELNMTLQLCGTIRHIACLNMIHIDIFLINFNHEK